MPSDSSMDSLLPMPELSPAGKALIELLATPKNKMEKQQLKVPKQESDVELLAQMKAVNEAVAKSPKLAAVLNELVEGSEF